MWITSKKKKKKKKCAELNQSAWSCKSAATVTCFQAAMLSALTSREGKMDLLPSLIPPYRWLSWWLLTRSFLSGPFLPPHRARRLQGGHGKASLPQTVGYYNCSLRICKPRCPSEAKAVRKFMPLRMPLAFFFFFFFEVFLSCRDKWEIQIREEKICGKNWTRVLHTTSHLPMETVIRISAALIINKLWLIHK